MPEIETLTTGTAASAGLQQTAVVFGGNGTVGLGVLEALSSAGGFDIHSISRRGGPPAGLDPQPWSRAVTWHACDVRDEASLARCLQDIAPTCAAITIGRVQAWDQLFPTRHAEVEDAAKTPALRALHASLHVGVTRLAYVSGLFPDATGLPGEPAGPARWLKAWLSPQLRAKAEVEATVNRLFSNDNGLIIRAGLVCGWFDVAGQRVWLPPFTRKPARIGLLRKLVPHAATAVEIGEACVAFFRGQIPGGVIEGGVRVPVEPPA